MPNPLISVVIGTFNQKDVLARILDAYNNQTLPKDAFEVIVVDSSSTDGSSEFLLSYSPSYKFNPIVQPNTGKASARNRGVREAKSDIILITDADMIPHPHLLETHVKAHQKAQQPSCFEGVTMNMTELHWPIEEKKLYPYITRTYQTLDKLGWYYFLTGNLSMPKALFLAENGFDQAFKGYGWEDLELGYRLSLKKVPLLYLKHAVNYHYHVVTHAEEVSRCEKKGESAKIFVQKHPELALFLGLNPLSKWVFKRLYPEGKVVQWIRKHCFDRPKGLRHRFGFWFLKEYYYLCGILC